MTSGKPTTREDSNSTAGGGNDLQAGTNVTTTTGSCKENNSSYCITIHGKGHNTRHAQLDDALVRRKKIFININFKEKNFK
jgi:hypothetical protein